MKSLFHRFASYVQEECPFLYGLFFAPWAFLRVNIIFWFRYGFLRSAFRSKAVDSKGRPISWFSYPAIEYLDQLDLSAMKVFEYGCGNSTLYWAENAESVVSVENNTKWQRKISTALPKNGRVILAEADAGYASSIEKEQGAFDLIVIDGSVDRLACAKAAIRKLAANGLIVLDDSEENTESAEFLRAQDLIEADFAGFKPAYSATKTTSFFFRPSFRPKYKTARAPSPSLGSVLR